MSSFAATPVGTTWRSGRYTPDCSSSSTRWLGDLPRSEWDIAYAQLAAAAELADNWDGYGAKAMDPTAVRRMRRFLAALQRDGFPAPRLVPIPDGGLQLEWTRGATELEIELDPAGSLIFVFDDPRVPGGIDGELPADEDKFFSVMQRLLAS